MSENAGIAEQKVDPVAVMYAQEPADEEPAENDEVAAESSESDVEDVAVEATEEPAEETVTEEASSEETEAVSEEVEEPDEVDVTTVDQLVEHLGVNQEWIEGLNLRQKVNGKEVDVTLGEILSNYRQGRSGEEILAEAKNRREELLSEVKKERDQAQETVAALAALVTAAENKIMQGFSSDDLKKLREQDPAEWTALQHELNQALQEVEKIKQYGIEKARTLSPTPENLQKLREQSLPKERELLLDLVPEWRDEAKASAESAKAAKYMQQQGFTPEEIEGIVYSGRDLSLIIKAMRYDQMSEKKQVVRKKITRIPKVMKPGTAKSESDKPSPKKKDPVSIMYPDG